MTVHVNLPADDFLVAAKPPLPVGVTQDKHRIGTGRLSLGRKNEATHRGLNTRGGKEVAGDARDEAVFAFAIDGETDERNAEGQEVAKNVGLISKVQIIGVREALKIG